MSTEKKCVFNECDGSGFIYTYYDNGERVVRNCRCVRYAIMEQRIKFLNMPAEFEGVTIKSFDTDIYASENSRSEARNIKKVAIQYVRQFEEMKKNGKGLYLYGGEKGSGKTRLAAGIGNALLSQHNASVSFISTVNLLEEIKSTWDDDEPKEYTQSKILAAIKRVDLLILDDIGTERPTSWVNEIFYNILNDRMTAKKTIIFTSNCRIEELKHDSRIVSRIPKIAVPVRFPEESVREVLAKRENEEVIKALLEGK